jgi:hypothetical protein
VSKPSSWLVAALLCSPTWVRADFTEECASALNYGANTATFFVHATFTRVARGTHNREQAHAAVDRMLAIYAGRRVFESEELSRCHVQGLWSGLTARLSLDYARLGGSDAFACLERPQLAAHARTILDAMATWTVVALDDVLALFAGETDTGGVPWCAPRPAEECTAVLPEHQALAELLCGSGVAPTDPD